MISPDEASALSTEIVDTAQALLDGHIGASLASRRIRDLAWKLERDPWQRECFRVFMAMDSETDHLPLGVERRHWEASALKQKDKEIAAFDARCRNDAISAAKIVIKEFGK